MQFDYGAGRRRTAEPPRPRSSWHRRSRSGPTSWPSTITLLARNTRAHARVHRHARPTTWEWPADVGPFNDEFKRHVYNDNRAPHQPERSQGMSMPRRKPHRYAPPHATARRDAGRRPDHAAGADAVRAGRHPAQQSNLRTVGNMQARNEAAAAAQIGHRTGRCRAQPPSPRPRVARPNVTGHHQRHRPTASRRRLRSASRPNRCPATASTTRRWRCRTPTGTSAATATDTRTGASVVTNQGVRVRLGSTATLPVNSATPDDARLREMRPGVRLMNTISQSPASAPCTAGSRAARDASLGEDIDIFGQPPGVTVGAPNVLFILDNSANWSRECAEVARPLGYPGRRPSCWRSAAR